MMPDELAEARARLERIEAHLLDMEDGLSRVISLCHLGSLAADGLQGLHENPAATAFSTYFSLLAKEIEMLRRTCDSDP